MGVSQIGFPQNTVYQDRIQTSETLPVTLQASKYGEFSFNITAGDGITPLGIVGWGCNDKTQVFLSDFAIDTGGQTAKLYLKNPYNTDISITSLWIDMLYTKIGLDMSEVTVIDNLTTDSGLDALSARQGKVLNEKIPPVVDNLTSTSTTSALSANQGKVLNEMVTNVSVVKGTKNTFQIAYSNVGFDDVFDKIPNNGMSLFLIEASLSAPWETTNYWGLQWRNGSGLFGTQIVFGFGSSAIAKRNLANGAWGSWVQIS